MSQPNLKIECVDKLGVLINTHKRIKILVGGRASTKSTFVADYVLSRVQAGERWCCSREYQNSIDDSVHQLLADEIERCGFKGFTASKSEINHIRGGKVFYRGLARNITSLKSMVAHGLWIEEGETLSADTMKILTASIRVSAKDVQWAKETGEDMLPPEIWITMNRGSTNDPVSKKFLARAEKDLLKHGFYEDDAMMIVQVNYDENPWFLESGLEVERLDDLAHMTPEDYASKWHGKYSDSVENAIIPVEWFNAAIDAHKKKGFEPSGIKVVSHDPSDLGPDPKGLVYRHGSVVLYVEEKETGTIDDGAKWALDYAIDKQVDAFVWDGDGMGVGIRKTVSDALTGKNIVPHMFRGSESPDHAADLYLPAGKNKKEIKGKTNKDTFYNKRAQYYWLLRERFYSTYLSVVKGEYIDPDKMISLSSDITCIDQLRAEVCRIPKKHNGNGKIQILSKDEMKRKLKIESPNMADSLMMCLDVPEINIASEVELNFSGWSG